jgi:hypothetical protein
VLQRPQMRKGPPPTCCSGAPSLGQSRRRLHSALPARLTLQTPGRLQSSFLGRPEAPDRTEGVGPGFLE